MSERWVKESEQLLKKMNELSSKEKKDRLETINSIIFALNILERSLRGWKRWVGNLSLMTEFTSEELGEIEQSLNKQIKPLVEYDVEVTKRWKDKFPQTRFVRRRRRARESESMYA